MCEVKKIENDPQNNGEPGPSVVYYYGIMKPIKINNSCQGCGLLGDGAMSPFYRCTGCGVFVHRGCSDMMNHCDRNTSLPMIGDQSLEYY